MTNTTFPSPSLTFNDFRPCCNGWKDYDAVTVDFSDNSQSQKVLEKLDHKQINFPQYLNEGKPLFKLDTSTGNLYFNIRQKSLRNLYILGAPLSIIATPLLLAITTIQKIFKVVSLYHFWKKSEISLSFSDKVKSTAADIARIAVGPLFTVGLVFCTFYGIIAPSNAGKIERTIFRLWDTGQSPSTPAFAISKSQLEGILSSLQPTESV
jgi:hypothetical protein